MLPKISILGTRGIPANYGGFETFAQELSTRLVKKGYEVAVYGRAGNDPQRRSSWQGVKLITLPTIRHKYFDTIANAFISVWHVSFSNVEIVYICNAINSAFALVPRLFGKKVIINVDGLEWKRTKWNKLGKWAYQVSEWIATVLANVIISDSKAIQEYYRKKFNKETVNISYGAQKKQVADSVSIIEKFGLKPRNYILYVSRLEPENNALVLIKAYEKTKTGMPLVIVGDAPYGKPYIAQLRSTRDTRIKFLGSVYGDGYAALQSNAYIYVHGNEVGGTNPALLEAMAFGNCVIANGVDFNKEVIGEAGFWWQPGHEEDLKAKMEYLLANPSIVEERRRLAQERVAACYNWDSVVAAYEGLFARMTHA